MSTMPRRDDVAYYRELFDSQVILPEWEARIEQAALKIAYDRTNYLAVSKYAKPVPWVFVGLLHYRERGGDFRYQVLNGEAWNVKTRLTPAGFGPWASWFDASLFGLKHWGMDKIQDWSIGRILMETEDWNGEGYEYRGLNSPYNWRGTNHAKGVGKFLEKIVNGKPKSFYSPEAEFTDQQPGCGPILKRLIEFGVWSETNELGDDGKNLPPRPSVWAKK